MGTHLFGAEVLYLANSSGKHIELSFDRVSKTLQLSIGSSKRRKSKDHYKFKIENPNDIDAHIAHATSLMQSQNIVSDEIENVVQHFEQFKFVSTANCQAIHLGEEVGSNTKAIEDLVSEFDRISAGIRGDGEFERSVELLDIAVPDSENFQLRALVDGQGRTIKLSLAQNGETLKDYKVDRQGDTFTLSSADNKPILSIKNYEMKNELVSVTVFNQKGLEDSSRIHLKLNAENSKAVASIIASSTGTGEERIGAVKLTTVSVSHKPVVRHEKIDIFIPTLETEILKQKIQNSPFGKVAIRLNNVGTKAQEFYDGCLGEAFILRSELHESDSDDVLASRCLTRLTLDFADRVLEQNPAKRADYRSCLQEIGVIRKNQNVMTFTIEGVTKESLLLCENRMEEFDVKKEIENFLSEQKFSQDESFAPLLSSITERALNVYRNCNGSDCTQKALKRASVEMYKLKFLRWFSEENRQVNTARRDELVNKYVTCNDSKSQQECNQALMSSLADDITLLMFNRILADIGLKESTDTKNLDAVKRCLKNNLDRIPQGDFLAFNEWNYHCSFEQFKLVFPNLASEYWGDKLKHYKLLQPIESVVNEVNSQSMKIVNVEEAKKVLLEAGITAHSAAGVGLLENRLASRFEGLSNEARDEIYDDLAAMTSPGTYDLAQGIAIYLRKAATSRGSDGVQTAFNDLVMRIHRVPRQYELVSSLGPSYKNHRNLEKAVVRINDKYEECWNNYDANSSVDALEYAKKCDKLSLAEERFELLAQQMRLEVSKRYPLASQEANEILTPLHYLDKCFTDGDPLGNADYDSFEKWIDSCVAVTKVDIMSNIFEKLGDKYTNVLKAEDKATLKGNVQCFADSLKRAVGNEGKRWFKDNFVRPNNIETARAVDDIMRVSNNLNGAGSLLSSMFIQDNFDLVNREGDRAVLLGYMKKFTEFGAADKVDALIEQCVTTFDKQISEGFRSYLLASVPNLFARIDLTKSEEQRKVVEEIIDVEMVELLLAVQRKNDRSVSISDTPSGTIVNGEFTIDALARFITGMGEYIGKGFVFDMDEMKTELVVFQSELKDALRWLSESDTSVTMADLDQFFKESKLADVMALAHVAKNTNDNFQSFISGMHSREISAFWTRVAASNSGLIAWIQDRNTYHLSAEQKAELKAINDKFKSLKDLSTKMTSSYDFRRIFNIHGQKGREVIELIKEKDFLLRVSGRTPSALNKEEVDKAIAEQILADNTPGGFTERFVAEMAQEYLTKESDSTWAITKWAFSDAGDYDWNVLRFTASGKKAIKYYGEHVLLPRMLGRTPSRYLEKLHKEKFEKLLRAAQSEN